jgi:SM-20-related protein
MSNQDFSSLTESGLWIAPHFFPQEIIGEMLSAAQKKLLRPAGIGKSAEIQKNIRSDQIYWLEWLEIKELAPFWQVMSDLKTFLRQELFIAVQDFEAHLACYPPGGFYQKHLDNPRGQSARFLTVLLYLNLAWQAEDDGALEIFSPDGEKKIAEVMPQGGTLVLFLSERFPHAVRLTQRMRWSICGWWRR